MAETKETIAAERDRLREENEALRAQLQRELGGRAAAAAQLHQFTLSEGARQELVARGVANIEGKMRTRDEVRDMLDERHAGVDLGDGPVDPIAATQERAAIPGVDFIYPSVRPGFIDPAVAGTPGINGPAAPEPDQADDGDQGDDQDERE